MIKLLVFDMDGTLLNEKETISKLTKEAIIECEKKGIKVVLASGRSYPRLKPYFKELEMEKYGGFLIEVNGMSVYDLKKDQREIIKQLTRDNVIELWNYFDEDKFEIQAYFDDGVFYYYTAAIEKYKIKEREERNLPESYPWIGGPWTWVNDSMAGYPKQARIFNQDGLKLPFYNKFNASGKPEDISSEMDNVLNAFKGKYEITRSCPRMIEISPLGITKGKTLEYFMDKYGYQKDEVMVFGDGENDIDMFSRVDHSFAMANAMDIVKEKAKYTAPSNREDGIAKTLKQFHVI